MGTEVFQESGKDVTYYVSPDRVYNSEKPMIPFGFPSCPDCGGQALTIREWKDYAWEGCPRNQHGNGCGCQLDDATDGKFSILALSSNCCYRWGWCPVQKIGLIAQKLAYGRRRRMAVREFSSRRDSPVLLRLLKEIREANRA